MRPAPSIVSIASIILLGVLLAAPAEAATRIRTTSIVAVKAYHTRPLKGGRSAVSKVLFAVNASHGRKYVRAQVNGFNIQDMNTDRDGFYVKWVDANKLKLRKGEVNVFRFVRPNGSVNHVHVLNTKDLGR